MTGRGRETIQAPAGASETSAPPEVRKERAEEYERAAELFADADLIGEAGRSWYQAAYEYSWLALSRSEYREKCYSACDAAAVHLEAAGDWWGAGLAEFMAGQTLLREAAGDPPSPRTTAALRRAAEAFTRADRPAEAAAAGMAQALALAQTESEAWIPTSVQALHTYEQARTSLQNPKDRQINDQIIVANGARVLTSKVSKTAVTLPDHPVWSELVWLLSEAPKARSFQDQHLQDDTWRRLAADDSTLSGLMTQRKDVVQQRTGITRMIKAAVMTGRSDRIPAMEQELKTRESALKDIGRQVTRRLQRMGDNAPEQIELLSTSPVTPQELQSCLEPGEAYISYRWNDNAPLRSIVTPSIVTIGLAPGVTARSATNAVAAAR